MDQIISDFFQLGPLRFVARFLMGLRGLFIAVSLTPEGLGEYTIWLLFVFYFFILDFGVLNGLERDLPHYHGQKNWQAAQTIAQTGWSSFFVLALGTSVLLTLTTFVVFKDWLIAVLLGVYLLTDKIYRAFDSNSRIRLQYRDNVAAELLNAAASFLFIWFFLPRFGVYGVFTGFILSSFISTAFLLQKSPLDFKWRFSFLPLRKLYNSLRDCENRLKLSPKAIFLENLRYLIETLPLSIVTYAIQIFHQVSITILALFWDKATLGFFAFAFRIFQIFLAIFPFLIRDVVRTRMYHSMGQKEGQENFNVLQNLFNPMGMYSLSTAFFWLVVYWWAGYVFQYFSPSYVEAVGTLQLFTIGLLPLGVAQVGSDYLCSRIYKKNKIVIGAWILGIFLQVALLIGLKVNPQSVLYQAPLVYLFATFVVYGIVTAVAFSQREKDLLKLGMGMATILMPLGIVVLINQWVVSFIPLSPSMDLGSNVFSFFIAVTASCLALWGFRVLLYLTKKYFMALSLPTAVDSR